MSQEQYILLENTKEKEEKIKLGAKPDIIFAQRNKCQTRVKNGFKIHKREKIEFLFSL